MEYPADKDTIYAQLKRAWSGHAPKVKYFGPMLTFEGRSLALRIRGIENILPRPGQSTAENPDELTEEEESNPAMIEALWQPHESVPRMRALLSQAMTDRSLKTGDMVLTLRFGRYHVGCTGFVMLPWHRVMPVDVVFPVWQQEDRSIAIVIPHSLVTEHVKQAHLLNFGATDMSPVGLEYRLIPRSPISWIDFGGNVWVKFVRSVGENELPKNRMNSKNTVVFHSESELHDDPDWKREIELPAQSATVIARAYKEHMYHPSHSTVKRTAEHFYEAARSQVAIATQVPNQVPNQKGGKKPAKAKRESTSGAKAQSGAKRRSTK